MNRIKIYLLSLLLLPIGNCIAQPGERGFTVKRDSSIVKGNTYAIIIGISEYKVVPHLQFAHKDAQSFESYLVSDAGGKVPQTNIETFVNENATRSNVGDAISVIARKAKPGDRVYFFFAGHGDMEDLTQIENGLLLLYNSPNGNYFGMNDDVLEILDLKRYLSPLAQRGVEMIFIVDACHSGNLKGGVEGVQQTASALASAWGKEYKILSCQPNQLSLESSEWGGGRGLFSLELEEGMKGLADKNNDGKVSFAELQRYLTDNVASYSEDKQIPLVMGDLSKALISVDAPTLALLKKQKAANYPMLANANTKGNEEKYIDSLGAAAKKLYASFKKNLDDKKLIWPKDTNALRDYRLFIKKYPDIPLVPGMRRNLATSLNERFNKIVSPILNGETSFSNRDECYYAAAELDSCLHLLGEQHYMYTNLKARKLFMDAMALTWALTESEYNVGLKSSVEKAITLLEQSEELEPNAAYTVEALGTRYFYVYEYDKAYAKFQKYLDLRPNDFFAKYSLAKLYLKLKDFSKAQTLFAALVKERPRVIDLYRLLADSYFSADNKDESLAAIQSIPDSVDKGSRYFLTGVYYSKVSKIDSAIHYYNLAKTVFGDCRICDNNIGNVYQVNNRMDSARFYFNKLIKADSLDPFPNFNLGTIDAKNKNYYSAIDRFITAIDHSPLLQEAYVTHLEIYFNKHYTVVDSSGYDDFVKRVFIFNLQYAGYLSILYCYLRDDRLSELNDKLELIFERMFTYKDFDVFTWYHHACYKALKNDKPAALESIEKALKLGFGNYFMLTSDDDLKLIRDTPEYKALLKKYFAR